MFNDSLNILTQEEMIKEYINDFIGYDLPIMKEGQKYYTNNNDINSRKMYRYEDERAVEDETKPNNRLSHSFMKLLVDEKVNYVLSKPFTLDSDNDDYLNKVIEMLGPRFQSTLKKLAKESSNKGIAWLHPYFTENGEFKVKKIPSEQIVPIWKDQDHEELEAVIRFYEVETYYGKDKRCDTKIEYWTADNVIFYTQNESGEVILDSEKYLDGTEDGRHFTKGNEAMSWGRVPFIPFKNNEEELPDLKFVKSLIDNYDLTRSDVSNTLEELKQVIYALKGYDGENLSEFMRDLAYYRAVKLDEDGGLEKIETTIDIEAAKTHYEQLKKDIYDFGQGVYKSSDKLGNSPSGIALKFMYSGLDLKCNDLEDYFKDGFNQLLYFVNIALETDSENTIEMIFNRDIAINESQAIVDCQNSKGIISDRTITANHPWVTDLEEELKQIEEDNRTLEPPLFSNEGIEDE